MRLNLSKLLSVLLFMQINLFSQAQSFSISYPNASFKGPFTGKVLIFLSKDTKEPKDNDFMVRISPFFSMDVKDIQPGQKIILDDKAISYPVKLSEIERGEYFVQAVWDRNLGGRPIGNSPGNLYSASQKVNLTADLKKIFPLQCDKVIEEPVFKNTEYIKEIKLKSKLLSAHQGKPVNITAALLLPKNYYSDSSKRYPLFVSVSGFGGDYHRYSGAPVYGKEIDSVQFVTIFLDGNCPLGHSVYANSDNNGPWGDALVKELIPEIEKQYRCDGFRVVNGHSSGGWSVLWLQTHYPETFNACWSSSPDPVDFRDFQKVNLYEDENIYYNKDGDPQPVVTIAGFIPFFYMKDYYQMEAAQYRGGQMHSFDAVFGEKTAGGEPARICEVKTGVINKKVFEHWKPYDISLYLRNNWPKLEPTLGNKILITMGEQDNFLLNYAVKRMEGEMRKINASVEFAYFPGDHFTVASEAYWKKGNSFIAKRYREWKKTK